MLGFQDQREDCDSLAQSWIVTKQPSTDIRCKGGGAVEANRKGRRKTLLAIHHPRERSFLMSVKIEFQGGSIYAQNLVEVVRDLCLLVKGR